MSASISVSILQTGLLIWLLALAGLVFLRIVSGKINSAGLLLHTCPTNKAAAKPEHIRPERMVLLVSSLGYAAYYTMTALQTPLDLIDPSLPEIPSEVITALLGTNGAYLSMKFLPRAKGN